MAMRAGDSIKDHVPAMMENLVAILWDQNQPQNLLENCTITVGRIGVACPQGVVPWLEKLLPHWLVYLSRVRDPAEKAHAYRGCCNVIQQNPNALLPHFSEMCHSFATCQKMPDEVKTQIRTLLLSFQSMLGAQWAQYWSRLQPELRQHLTDVFKLTS
jgi:transportin-1